MLFHKYVVASFSVANCMSHFSMFIQTKVTLKLPNGIMGHAQVSGFF